MERSVLDGVIRRLVEVRGRPGKQVQLTEQEIKQLCVVSREIFLKQPNLLELEAPIKICGMVSCFWFMGWLKFGFLLMGFVCLVINLLYVCVYCYGF